MLNVSLRIAFVTFLVFRNFILRNAVAGDGDDVSYGHAGWHVRGVAAWYVGARW